MKTTAFTLCLSILASVVAGSALPEFKYPDGVVVGPADTPYPGDVAEIGSVTARGLEKRRTHEVRICTDRNFEGHCVTIWSEHDVCVPLGFDLEDKVSSFGPAPGGTRCSLYVDRNCRGDNFATFYPGERDLDVSQGGRFNDNVSSYRCVDI